MSFIQYKMINNKKYAYEMTAHWDKEKKQSRSISKYLGPVDLDTNEIITFTKKIKASERAILDFGDGYFLYEWIKRSEFFGLLNTYLFQELPGLFPVIIYRLCMQSAMYNCETWYDGNVVRCFFKDINLSSQRISDMLTYLGSEAVQRSFFNDYLHKIGGSQKSVIIDATSLPNQVHIDYNAWGHSDGKIEKQFRLLCVIDQESKTPLFYRFLPGNITDITTLQTTIIELKAMGVQNSFILMDAGYFSEENVLDLFKRKINFMTRMPSNRKLYRDIVCNKSKGIEKYKYASVMGDRSYFVKSIKIDLYGHKAYTYIILDPDRKAKESKELLQRYCKNKKEELADEFEFLNCGIMLLVSSKKIPADEVLSTYYLRLSVEQVFCIAKSDLNLLPIRNHNENTVRGYLFLQFILLILYLKLKSIIDENITVERALLVLRKLKCKIFNDQIVPSELSKQQREIFEQGAILVPKFLGI